MKPSMQVVQLQQRTHILFVSGQGAKSLDSDEFIFDPEGLEDDDV